MGCNDQFKIENILLYTEHMDCVPYYYLLSSTKQPYFTTIKHEKLYFTRRFFVYQTPKVLNNLVLKSSYLKIGYRTDFRPVPLKVQLCFNGKLWNMVDGKQRLDTALPNHKELESFSGTGCSRTS